MGRECSNIHAECTDKAITLNGDLFQHLSRKTVPLTNLDPSAFHLKTVNFYQVEV